ncbi:Serine/threonine-protein kinase PknB [Stieleria neptunia]|uniref:Serine/threonine-protein kinase PknB n=1 Tax=Stieleria neptunia TaxID=2527979 RepID=A0A518HRX3_9BACT|nr:hypothetical protein [Stieleria neptunia]QDV43599.1 Serine/threonine-protein kinase PknB [Stieleria neptunia]
MSPEQARGDLSQVGPASDQFNLGVMLYEILAGRKPFNGESHAVLNQIAKGDITPPSKTKADCDVALEAICLKALSQNPTDRYESCDAMADDLQRWCEGELVQATKPSWITQTVHWGRKRPHWAAWIIAAAASVVATSGITFVVGVQKIAEASEIESKAIEPLESMQREVLAIPEPVEPVPSEVEDAPPPEDEPIADPPAEAEPAIDTDRPIDPELLDYAEKLEQVSLALSEERIERSHQLLDRMPWRFRGVEHSLLRRRALGTPFRIRHSNSLQSVAWTPDSSLLVTGDSLGVIRFWDSETLQQVGQAEISRLIEFAFPASSNSLLSVQQDGPDTGSLTLWQLIKQRDRYSLKKLWQTKMPMAPADMAFHPKRPVVAVGGKPRGDTPSVSLFHFSDSDVALAFQPKGLVEPIGRLAFTADGSRLDCQGTTWGKSGRPIFGIAGAGQVRPLSESETRVDYHNQDRLGNTMILSGAGHVSTDFGSPPRTKDGWTTFRGHESRVNLIARRPDQQAWATADQAGDLRIWPTSGRKADGVTVPLKGPARIDDSHDGRLAACSAPKQEILKIWDTASGEIRHNLVGHEGGIQCVRFHPRNDSIVTADGVGTIRLWDLADESMKTWKIPGVEIRDVRFSPSGTQIAICGSGELPWTPTDAKTSADASDASGGNASGGFLGIWDARNGKLVRTFQGHRAIVSRCLFSPEGDELLSASEDGTVRRWLVSDAAEIGSLDSPGYTPDQLDSAGEHLAVLWVERCDSPGRAGCSRGRSHVDVHDRTSLKRLYRKLLLPPQSSTDLPSIDLNDDGSRILVNSDAGAQILDTATGLHLIDVKSSPVLREASREVQALKYRTETRTREIPVTKWMESDRDQTVEGKMVENEIEILERQIPFGARVHRLIVTSGATDKTIETTYYVKVVEQNRIVLCSDEQCQMPIELTELRADDDRVRMVLKQIFPVTQAVEQIYTVQVPYFETLLQTYSYFSSGLHSRDVKFAKQDRGILAVAYGHARVIDAVLPESSLELRTAGTISVAGFRWMG